MKFLIEHYSCNANSHFNPVRFPDETFGNTFELYEIVISALLSDLTLPLNNELTVQ